MNKTQVQQKLIDVVSKTGITLADVARDTNISKENIYKWHRGTKPSDSYAAEMVITYCDHRLQSCGQTPLGELAVAHALRKGAGGEFVTRHETSFMMRFAYNQSNKPVPALIAPAPAGSVVFMNNEPELLLNRIDAPFIGTCDGAVEVTGKSMEPLFPPGSQVLISKIKHLHLLEYGQCYFIIDKNYRGMVKRVFEGPEEDSICLRSDNPDKSTYKDLVRRFAEIEAVFRVIASISKH